MSRKAMRQSENGALLPDEETILAEQEGETVEVVAPDAPDAPPPGVGAESVAQERPEEALISAELQKRKPRKKREDAGKQRKRKATSGLEEESEALEGNELETVCKTIAEVATGGLMSLSIAFARSRNNANLVMTEQDASNFNVAFKFIAKKYASVISESPEMYLLGIAVLGYAGRVTACDSVDYMSREA